MTAQRSASTRAEIVTSPPTRTYWVAVGGGGTLCNESAPCALSDAIREVQPGEEIVLRGGLYYVGGLDLPRAGRADAPIVIRGEAGVDAILDGAEPEALAWTREGELFRTTLRTPEPHLVLVDGARLYPYASLAALRQLDWGVPGFYAAGNTLYLHLATSVDPATVPVVVSRHNYAFYVAVDHIRFRNLTFRHYGQGEYAKAIYLDGASDCVIHGCTFAMNDLGVGLKRAAHRNVIEDSIFFDAIFHWPWDAVKEADTLETGGVRFYDPVDGRGNVIRRNTLHGYFDGLGVCAESSAALTDETDVYENVIYRAADDGIETDGRCSNVRIWGNEIHDVLMGISLAPTYVGPVYVMRNVIHHLGVGENDYSGSAFKFNSGYDHSGVMFLFHNTCDAAVPGNDALIIGEPGSWEHIISRNNIWSGTQYAIANYNPGQAVDLDYDALWNSVVGELAWWGDLPDRHLNSVAELQAATGQERHGIDSVPGFSNAAAGDYRLAPGSGLIDAGIVLPGINDVGAHAYRGSAPDIGAFESEAQVRCLFLPRLARW